MARDRRVLPHNIDAEASILGGIILRNDVLLQLETLEIEDFYHHQHKVVFEAIRNLEAAAKPIDVVTLENEVAKKGKLEVNPKVILNAASGAELLVRREFKLRLD